MGFNVDFSVQSKVDIYFEESAPNDDENKMFDSCSEAESIEMKSEDLNFTESVDMNSDCGSDIEAECSPMFPQKEKCFGVLTKTKVFEVPQLVFNRLQRVRFDFDELRKNRKASLCANVEDRSNVDCGAILMKCIMKRSEIQRKRNRAFACKSPHFSLQSGVVFAS